MAAIPVLIAVLQACLLKFVLIYYSTYVLLFKLQKQVNDNIIFFLINEFKCRLQALIQIFFQFLNLLQLAKFRSYAYRRNNKYQKCCENATSVVNGLILTFQDPALRIFIKICCAVFSLCNCFEGFYLNFKFICHILQNN